MRDAFRLTPTIMPTIGTIWAIFRPTSRAPRAANRELTDAVSALFPIVSIDPRRASLRITLLRRSIDVSFSTTKVRPSLSGDIAWDKTIAAKRSSAGSSVSYP